MYLFVLSVLLSYFIGSSVSQSNTFVTESFILLVWYTNYFETTQSIKQNLTLWWVWHSYVNKIEWWVSVCVWNINLKHTRSIETNGSLDWLRGGQETQNLNMFANVLFQFIYLLFRKIGSSVEYLCLLFVFLFCLISVFDYVV